MKLSIVIVSWNSVKVLSACLRSVGYCTDRGDCEILLVDNGSTDDSAKAVAREFPLVKLSCNKTNKGFGAANNQGARSSTGDYLLFLNIDTVVPAGAIEELVKFMDEHPEAGACGPRLLRPDGVTQPFAFGRDPQISYLLARGVSHLFFRRPVEDWGTNKIRQVDWVSGACFLARRAAFEQVGGFDESFFMYFEDNDLCLRMRRSGWNIFYNPMVQITHIGGASVSRNAARTGWYYASLRHFYLKHYSGFEQLLLWALLTLYRPIGTA